MAQVVHQVNHHLRQESKGYDRLHYDLLYLPLFFIGEHRERVRHIIHGYLPKAKYMAKYNVHQVLNCYFEYPESSCFSSEIKALCRSILASCLEDIGHQRKEHPERLMLGHIAHALRHPELSAEAARAKTALVAYGGQHPDFQQSALYQEAAGLAVAEAAT